MLPPYLLSLLSILASPPPDETSGEINRNPTEQIDRERMAQYNLGVVARDDGDPELNATVLVRIDILVSVGV